MKGSNKTTVSPYSQREGKLEGRQQPVIFLRPAPLSPAGSSRLRAVRHCLDLDFPVCIYGASNNTWIKLSPTLPLRKDIPVQARRSLSAIKLVGPSTAPSVTVRKRPGGEEKMERPTRGRDEAVKIHLGRWRAGFTEGRRLQDVVTEIELTERGRGTFALSSRENLQCQPGGM